MSRKVVLVAIVFLAVGWKVDDAHGGDEGPRGKELWRKACEHAIDLMAESPQMKDVSNTQFWKAFKGASKECIEEYRKAGGEGTDESARCVLDLRRFDPELFAGCEPGKVLKGDALWRKACEHAVDLMAKSPKMRFFAIEVG